MVLQKLDQAELVQPLAHLPRGLDDRREGDVRAGIEIEHQPAGDFRPTGLAIPGMQFEGADLRDARPALDPIDLQIGLAVAEHRHQLEQVGGARHGVALEELLRRRCRPARGRSSRAVPAMWSIIQAPTAS